MTRTSAPDPAWPDGDTLHYEVALWLSTSLWRRGWDASLLTAGEHVDLHRDIPAAVVVRAASPTSAGSRITLMRMPPSTLARPPATLLSWERALAAQGWQAIPMPRSPE